MSVTITVNLDTLTPKTAKVLITALQGIGDDHVTELVPDGEQVHVTPHEATRRPIPSQMPVAIDVELLDETPADFAHVGDTLPSEVEPADPTPLVTTPAKKRGRPRKEAAATAEPEPTEPKASTPAQPVAAPSVDELRAALQGYTEKHGMQNGIDLLKEFGAARISELVALGTVTQVAFMSHCNA